MTNETARTDLKANLNQVTTWLESANLAEAWQRPQGEKWTIDQEFSHLLRSTYGLVRLFGEPGRSNWRATDRPSRTYDEIVAQYKAMLPLVPPGINGQIDPQPFEAQRAAWHQTLAGVEATLTPLTNDDLLNNTVWKHPLLGPVTGLEMLYFTIYHTQHHLGSMKGK